MIVALNDNDCSIEHNHRVCAWGPDPTDESLRMTGGIMFPTPRLSRPARPRRHVVGVPLHDSHPPESQITEISDCPYCLTRRGAQSRQESRHHFFGFHRNSPKCSQGSRSSPSNCCREASSRAVDQARRRSHLELHDIPSLCLPRLQSEVFASPLD